MMASSMVKLISKTLYNADCKYSPLLTVVRHTSIKKKPPAKFRGTIKHRNLIKSSFDSLAARGFLRSYKPYTPVGNVQEKVLELSKRVLGTCDTNTSLSNEDKFVLLNTCFEELNYGVPNSQLHKIVNIQDVIEFYETPVSTTCPYDELKNKKLPPNLHIQYDYFRFDPETDTLFNGVSAFPRSSTIVTGIQYRDKYKGVTTRSPYKDAEVHTTEEYES